LRLACADSAGTRAWPPRPDRVGSPGAAVDSGAVAGARSRAGAHRRRGAAGVGRRPI